MISAPAAETEPSRAQEEEHPPPVPVGTRGWRRASEQWLTVGIASITQPWERELNETHDQEVVPKAERSGGERARGNEQIERMPTLILNS